METQSPPFKVARLADSENMVGEERGGNGNGSSSSVGLDLGLAPPHGKPCFTFFQLQELEHQALIYKYMAAGFPVPSHLVLPIWKSLGATYAGTGIYPSFLGCTGVCFDYRNSMEPEPGRCRRTDGKKWRCAKDVVPDQKYCERHMHRGRNRSRKHVETGNSSQIVTIASTSGNLSNNNNNTTNLSVSMPSSLQLIADPSAITAPGTSNNNNNTNVSPKSVLHESSLCKG